MKIVHRSFTRPSPKVTRGNGFFLEVQGKRLLDMSSSACTTILGHSNKYVIERIHRQLTSVPNVFSGFWTSDVAEQAAELVAQHMGNDWFGGVHFLNTGGEAVDLACKLAYQYHAEAGESNRVSFRSLEHAFHGVGLLPFALTGSYPRYSMMDKYHRGVAAEYVMKTAHPYNVGDDEAIDNMDAWMDRDVAAVIVEPIGGPPLGAYPHTYKYLSELRKMCDNYGALLIFDEILCGSGRCGKMSVKDLYNVQPDIVLLGKGLSNGYVPMSAIVMSKEVSDRIARLSGSLMFGTTYSNHTLGCAAVAGTIEYMTQRDLYSRSRMMQQQLERLAAYHLKVVRGVGQIRACGSLLGIELRNSRSGDYLPAALGFHAVARSAIADQGVSVYTKGQTMNGLGDFITIAPPVEATTDLLADGFDRIASGLLVAFDTIKEQH